NGALPTGSLNSAAAPGEMKPKKLPVSTTNGASTPLMLAVMTGCMSSILTGIGGVIISLQRSAAPAAFLARQMARRIENQPGLRARMILLRASEGGNPLVSAPTGA